jgi:hypothetical protein
MKRMHHALIGLLVAFTGVWPMNGAESSGSARRQQALELGTRLLAPRANPAANLPDSLVNPFNPRIRSAKGSGDSKSDRGGGRSDREVLEKLAPTITPSGMMVLGGRPRLIFGEKKYGVGDTIKRTFEGADYAMVISAIEETSFRLRLNSEEITRPIKPAKIP